jgi:hypothetical protein
VSITLLFAVILLGFAKTMSLPMKSNPARKIAVNVINPASPKQITTFL